MSFEVLRASTRLVVGVSCFDQELFGLALEFFGFV